MQVWGQLGSLEDTNRLDKLSGRIYEQNFSSVHCSIYKYDFIIKKYFLLCTGENP
jgi:hypothetical protein